MEMIERVAKSQSDFDGRPWLSMSKSDRQRYIDRAKAAIDAMHEPTDGMLTKAWNLGDLCTEEIKDRWHAMIDAALKQFND